MVALLPAPQPLDGLPFARGESKRLAAGLDPLGLDPRVLRGDRVLELAPLAETLQGAQLGDVDRLLRGVLGGRACGGETSGRVGELPVAFLSEGKLARERLLGGGLGLLAKLSHSFELESKAAHDDAARNRPYRDGLEVPSGLKPGRVVPIYGRLMSGVAERILCVEDDLQVRRLITRLVRAAGYDCAGAGDAAEARDLLDRESFSVVLCDIGLPGESGLELLREVSGRRPDVAMLMVTGQDEPEVANVALDLGAYGYLTKPFAENALRINLSNALHRRRLELERRTYEETLEATVALRTAELRESVSRLAASESDLRKAYRETVVRLGRAIEYHDGVTGAHVERVASYAAAIAYRLGVEPERAELLRLASPLHDVGKLAIGEHILAKPAPLTRDERSEIEGHTEAGHRLLTGSGNELLELAATIARSHHERWDGTGYPSGLAGEKIPLEGRIVSVADVFDALTSDRPYRPGLTTGQAREHIAAEAGTAFDPGVVAAFLELEL